MTKMYFEAEVEAARKQAAEGVRAAVKIIIENHPGAALNACREDEPVLAAYIDSIRRPK